MRRLLRSAILLLALLSTSILNAAPLSDEVIEKLKSEGQLDRVVATYQEAKGKGIDHPNKETAGWLRQEIASKGKATMRALVLLIDFPDKPYTAGAVAPTAERFDSLLFSDGRKNPTGSLKEFYLENSYGSLTVNGNSYGWFRASQSYKYYTNYCDGSMGFGTYPNNAQRLVEEAIDLADPYVDFSQFDTDGDQTVDALFIVHAGRGYDESGDECEIWSHSGGISEVYRDGVFLFSYTLQPEENWYGGGMAPIGVYCHEFGHILGLPDLYDYDASSAGCGHWTLMASGCNNGGLHMPAHLDAWCKAQLGFVVPTNAASNLTGVEFPAVEWNPVIYRVWANGIMGNEYFLVENRQLTGFDASLPGQGILIWHIDDNAWGNEDEWHPIVFLEQADGNFDLQYYRNYGDGGDAFPNGTAYTQFDDKTIPNSKDYSGAPTQTAVWDITPSDSVMTANIDVYWARPYFAIDSGRFQDDNMDGFFDSGETARFFFFLRNDWVAANNVTVTATSNDTAIHFSNPSVYFSIIDGGGGTVNNLLTPIVYVVPDVSNPTLDTFFVTVESDGGQFQKVFPFEQVVGHTRILMVDDDRGGNYETIYNGDLSKRRIPIHSWNKQLQGVPASSVLDQYSMVIWFTGDSANDYLQAADIDVIKQYLDGGGNVFLSGQGLAKELHAEDSAFLENYLHARYTGNYFWFEHAGVAGSPIGDGLKVAYFSGCNQALSMADNIEVVNGAVPEFRYDYAGGGYSALSYSGTYKLVFFGWGFEAIDNNGIWNSRDTVMSRLLMFLGGWGEVVPQVGN